MDTARYKAFVASVKTGSFSRAAEDLNYTTSGAQSVGNSVGGGAEPCAVSSQQERRKPDGGWGAVVSPDPEFSAAGGAYLSDGE